MTLAVFIHVNHLLGVGHYVRAAAIARAFAAAGHQTTLATGGTPLAGRKPQGVTIVELPSARSADLDYSHLVDADGKAVDDAWRERRRAATLGAFTNAVPDVLIVETYPFGRRQLAFELDALVEAARARKPRPMILASVRDLPAVPTKPGRVDETHRRLNTGFDAVLVHGDPTLIRFQATWPRVEEIVPPILHTGFVVEEPAASGETHPAEILVSAGGGAFGEKLLHAALDAQALVGTQVPWRILVGNNLPEDRFTALAATPRRKLIVERARADFPARLRHALLSVSQAGYNTTMETLRAGTRAVLVPYVHGTETEQLDRARLLAARGLCACLPEVDLTPARLAAAVDAGLAQPRPPSGGLDLDGARGTVTIVERLAAAR